MKMKWIVGIGFLLLVFVCLGCDRQCELQADNKAVVMQVAEAMNNFDFDRMADFIAQDYRRHCQATPEVTIENLDDFIALMKGFGEAFPDGRVRLDMLIAEGDLVAFWGTYLGTHTGPMGDIPATGKKIDSEMGGVHRIENGKIAETWVTWDNMAMLAQLGIFPPPAADTTASGE